MIALLVLGVLAFAALMVFGVLLSVLGFVIALPFRILGLMFRLVGLVIALPVLLLVGLFAGGGVLLAVVLGLLVPALPLVAIGALAWWLFTRDSRRPRDQDRSRASVVS